MVGPKLKTALERYLGTPYWKNILDQDGKIIKEGAFAGKGSPDEIDYVTRCLAFEKSIDINTLSADKVKQLQVENQIGVDCSGYVYNLLNAFAQDMGLPGIYYKLVGSWKGITRLGARSISATNFADPVNSLRVDNMINIKTGDYIVMIGKDGQGHVILILENNTDYLLCTHSSSETSNPCVHEFKIYLKSLEKQIQEQDWQETLQTGDNYLSAYDLTNPLTGVYRPLFSIK